jgi:hypothetical protein
LLKEVQAANKHIKKCYPIKDRQIRMTLRFHLTHSMPVIKKTNNKMLAGYREKGAPHTLLVGMYINAVTMENSMEVP